METYPLNEIYKCKLLMIGSSGVGKTAIMERFTNNQFSNRFIATVGKKFLITS